MKLFAKLLFCVLLCGALLALGGCGSEETVEDNDVIQRSALDSDEMIQSLLDRQGTLIGESNIVRELLCDILPGKNCVVSYDITLNRLTITYGPTKEEPSEETTPTAEEDDGLTPTEFNAQWDTQTTEDTIFYNSSALFALIPNLESVQYLVEGYGLPTFTISRENMNEFYGMDLGEVTSISLWKQTIDAAFTDSTRVDTFFSQYPMKSKDYQPTEEEQENGAAIDSQMPTEEELQRAQQTEEPEVVPEELPTEIQ